MHVKDVIKMFPEYEKLFENTPEKITLYIESFKKDTVIVQSGDVVDRIMVLTSGDMVVYNEYIDGDVIYVQSDEVTFIGDIEIVAGHDTYVCSVMASSDCKAVSMSIEDFLEWFNTDISLIKEMATRLAKRNCLQSSSVGSLKYHSTEQRVIKFIIDRINSHDLLKSSDRCKLSITREVIAYQVGASERMINRVIGKLKENNLLDTGYGELIISKKQFTELSKLLSG